MRTLFTILLIGILATGVCANTPGGVNTFHYIKLRQWCNVADFGAPTDSSASARAAFVAAAEAVPDSGGVIYIPPGRYWLDSVWHNIKSNTTVIGSEGATIYCGIESQADSSRNAIFLDGKTNVELRGLRLVGDADSSALVANNQIYGNGVMLVSCTYVSVIGCEATGFEWGIRITGDANDVGGGQSTHCTVEDCDTHGNQRDGIIISNASHNTIVGCRSYDNGKLDYATDTTYSTTWDANSGDIGAGISIRQFTFGGTEDTARYNHIYRNRVYENRGHGILVWRQDSTTEMAVNTDISANICNNNRYNGIGIASAPYTLIQGNTCYNNNRPNNWNYNIFQAQVFGGSGIHVELWSDNVIVANNVAYETKVFDTADVDNESQYAGILAGDGSPKDDSLGYSAVEPPPDSITIINNVCYNNRRYQMAVLDSANSADYYTARQIDGFAVNGLGETDTLWRTDNELYRDGRDNICLDSLTRNRGATTYGNTYGVAPHEFIIGKTVFPTTGQTDGYVLKTDGTDWSWAAESGGAADSVSKALQDALGNRIDQVYLDTAKINDSLALLARLAGATYSGDVSLGGNNLLQVGRFDYTGTGTDLGSYGKSAPYHKTTLYDDSVAFYQYNGALNFTTFVFDANGMHGVGGGSDLTISGAVEWNGTAIADGYIPDGITITRASDVDTTGTQIAAALAARTGGSGTNADTLDGATDQRAYWKGDTLLAFDGESTFKLYNDGSAWILDGGGSGSVLSADSILANDYFRVGSSKLDSALLDSVVNATGRFAGGSGVTDQVLTDTLNSYLDSAAVHDSLDIVRGEAASAYETITNVGKIADDTASWKACDARTDEDAEILTEAEAAAAYQPLETTLTDIADGTIAENLVNTAHPWADDEVADDITINYSDSTGEITDGAVNNADLASTAVDSTKAGNDALSETDVNWTYEWIYLTDVYTKVSAFSDSTYLYDFIHLANGDSCLLLLDSAGNITPGIDDTVSVGGYIPHACIIDSVEIEYMVSTGSEIIDGWLKGPDRSTPTGLCDSTYETWTTDLTSTTWTTAQYGITDITASAGDRFAYKYIVNFDADNDRLRIGWIRLRVRWL